MAILVTGCEMTAGVHSTVWIFATRAALTSRAFSKSWSSSSSGCSRRSRSQIALCSRANTLTSIAHADPEAGHPRRVLLRVVVGQRYDAVGSDLEAAALAGAAEPGLVLGAGAVDRGQVPPVGEHVDEGGWPVRVGRPGRVGSSCAARASGPAASRRRPTAGRRSAGSASPWPWLNQSWIMNCSHDGDQRVDRRGRQELRAGEQPPAHLARVRLQQRGLGVGVDAAQRDVAPEARAGHAGPRGGQVVVAAVRRAHRGSAGGPAGASGSRGQHVAVVQVVTGAARCGARPGRPGTAGVAAGPSRTVCPAPCEAPLKSRHGQARPVRRGSGDVAKRKVSRRVGLCSVHGVPPQMGPPDGTAATFGRAIATQNGRPAAPARQ